MSEISNLKDQAVSKVESKAQSAAASIEGKAKAEVTGLVGRVTAALAKHPKTVVVVAFIVGALLGLTLGVSATQKPVSASGATAPHEAYSALPVGAHEYVPMYSAAQGNG